MKRALIQVTKLQVSDAADHNERYNGTSDGRVTEMMNTMAKAIRSLSYDAIKSLYKETYLYGTKLERVRR